MYRWPLPAQSISGPSPLGLATVFYCLRSETSLFVASNDSQGHGGGIQPRLHTGYFFFSSNHTLKLYRLTYCTLLQLRTSRGYFLPRTSSSLNRMNSITYIAEERTCFTGNTCHVTTTHCCVMSQRTRKTQLPLLLRVWPCLQELLPGNALIKSVKI
jgi:hypothetical protein